MHSIRQRNYAFYNYVLEKFLEVFTMRYLTSKKTSDFGATPDHNPDTEICNRILSIVGSGK